MRLIQSVRSVPVTSAPPAQSVASAVTTEPATSSSDRPFKVGDEVVVTKWDQWQKNYFQGELDSVKTIEIVDGQGSIRLGKRCYFTGNQLRHAKYEPKVGDVVEWGTRKGIIFNPEDREDVKFGIAYSEGLGWDIVGTAGRMTKVACTDKMGSAIKCKDAKGIAKSYFALEPSD